MNEDLKLIKKHYGENMMHFCRELFPPLCLVEADESDVKDAEYTFFIKEIIDRYILFK